MISALIIFVIGACTGLLVIICLDLFEKKHACSKAKIESFHVTQESEEKAEVLIETSRSTAQAEANKLLKNFEREREKYEDSIRVKQSQADKQSYQLKLKEQEQEKKSKFIKKNISAIQSQQENLYKQSQIIEMDVKAKEQNITKKLQDHFSIDASLLKKQIKKTVEESWLEEKSKEAEKYEKEQSQLARKSAIHYLNLALNRFERAYCPRRTIEPVIFKNLHTLEKIAGKDQINITEIEKECGVDLLVNKEDLSVKIFGIDPVRRELGRITVRSLIKKRYINSKTIKMTVKSCKKELFETIHRDGATIARNLKLKNIAPEVLNMMGALKYRYSFAQNQYYHCEEVGWLCGLLNAEFSLPAEKGKRSGMFHDIGKAIDHSIEGSHAVIGAELLSKNSESEDIVHAVRAHHHDETPSTPLAYLVIAADAISGSRPGARHFTEDSYSRKMASLERIVEGFDNIEDAYIMSAGREMRVIVDNTKVSDEDALDLSKKIARQIEKECSYPGLITVTVVRHSEVYSMAQ